MTDLLQYPKLLRLLSYAQRIKGPLLGRKSGVAAAEKHRDAFYEEVWQDAAATVGATIEPLGYGIYEISAGGARTRVFQNHSPIDDEITLLIAGNKPLVNRLLAKEKLPTPKHIEFTLENIDRAVAFLEEMNRECVVKPARDTGGGLGVTTGVTNKSTLARAAVIASAHGKELLMEEQVEGNNYRLLYLDGVLLDAIIRNPPTVVGDGASTVSRLVEIANGARVARGASLAQTVMTRDLDMERTLARQGLSFASVPEKGRVVRLKTVVNENCATDNESATRLLCDSIVEAGSRAARAVGARLAGVDVVTSDPGVPLEQSGGVILEVNTTPGYYCHYKRRGGAFPVAVYVLESLLGVSRMAPLIKPDFAHRSKTLTA